MSADQTVTVNATRSTSSWSIATRHSYRPAGSGSPPAPEPAHPGRGLADRTGEALHRLGDGTDSTLQSLLDYLLR